MAVPNFPISLPLYFDDFTSVTKADDFKVRRSTIQVYNLSNLWSTLRHKSPL